MRFTEVSRKQEIKHQGAPWLLKGLALHHIICYYFMHYRCYNINHLLTGLIEGPCWISHNSIFCLPNRNLQCLSHNCNSVCLHISGSRVGSEEALYLYTSGPDLTSIMPCRYGKPSGTFSKFVTEEGLKCEHVRELLMKNKDVDTTALVVSLSLHEALTQCPYHSNKTCTYEI